MPRILKRLVEQIRKQVGAEEYFPLPRKTKRPKSLYDPQAYLPLPSLNAADYSRSVLLNDPSENVITRSKVYSRHKSLPPRVDLPPKPKARAGEKDAPRKMTEQERRWWTNPYLRMLSTPMRLCLETDQYLPTDLLVRIVSLRLPSSTLQGTRAHVALVPDGLLHSKFTARKSDRAVYVLCLREAVDRLASLGKYRRMFKEDNITVSSRLSDQIAHHLRLRVLQEFTLLKDRLTHGRANEILDGGACRLVRRLTREELESINLTGVIPFENALAVLEVPPVEDVPFDKERSVLAMSSSPPQTEERIPTDEASPLSDMMSGSSDFWTSSDETLLSSQLLPPSRVPYYHGPRAFPYAVQRTALHNLLVRLSTLEDKWARSISRLWNTNQWQPSDSSATHAFLLSADSENVKRGDMAAVAIALWRLQMFESGGWVNSKHGWSLGTNRNIESLL